MNTKLLFRKENILLFLLLATSFCFGQTITINATLENPCSILLVEEGNKDFDFIIYPNPSNGNVSIKLKSKITGTKPKIEVFDMSGKLVYEKKTFENNNSHHYNLLLNNLISGVYVLMVKYNGAVISKKLIINK